MEYRYDSPRRGSSQNTNIQKRLYQLPKNVYR